MKTVKKISTLLLAVPILLATLALNTADNAKLDPIPWKIDKVHSNIKFQVRHFFTPVEGSFEDYEGKIHFSPDDLAGSTIDVKIPIESINTKNKKRDGHLMSEDFFHAEKHPYMHFKSTSIKKAKGKNSFVAKGTMTIRGEKKDFDLPFQLLGVQDHPMKDDGTKLAGIKSSFKINRTDYNVGVNDWAATAVVGDEVTVELLLELNSI